MFFAFLGKNEFQCFSIKSICIQLLQLKGYEKCNQKLQKDLAEMRQLFCFGRD